MFSLEKNKVGLIDFLDSFLESPIVDIVKMRQDTKFHWTSRRCQKPHDRIKVLLLGTRIDEWIDASFAEWIHTHCFNVVEKINYLRIAPYVRSSEDHEYLLGALNKIDEDIRPVAKEEETRAAA